MPYYQIACLLLQLLVRVPFRLHKQQQSAGMEVSGFEKTASRKALISLIGSFPLFGWMAIRFYLGYLFVCVVFVYF